MGALAGLVAVLNVLLYSKAKARIAVGFLALISIASLGWSYSVLDNTDGSWMVPSYPVEKK